MTTGALSLARVREELRELQADRKAFCGALDILRARVRESIDSSRAFPPLHKWSGTRACVGALEMATQHIERCIEEHAMAVRLLESGELPDLDRERTPLGVIQGGDTE